MNIWDMVGVSSYYICTIIRHLSISYMVYCIACITYHISCIVHRTSYIIYIACICAMYVYIYIYILSYNICLTTYIMYHISNIIYHISFIMYHLSHIIYQISYIIFMPWREAFVAFRDPNSHEHPHSKKIGRGMRRKRASSQEQKMISELGLSGQLSHESTQPAVHA